jgi:NADH-quinone oxidoreductase subunit H
MYFEFTWTHFWITLVLIAALMGAVQGTCAYLILAERKISAWAQDRIGPNRVGRDFGLPFGLLQPIADGLKFLFKEQVIPSNVDKLFYLLGPMVALSTALMAIAVVPFGRTTPAPTLLDRRTEAMVEKSAIPLSSAAREKLIETNTEYGEPRGAAWPGTETEKAYLLAADAAWARAESKPTFSERVAEYNDPWNVQFVIAPHIDIGIVYVFAIGSLAVYAIVLGGWSSNNKYSFLGSLRSSAQLISYEIPMGMTVLGVFIVTGSLNLEKILDYQYQHGWNVVFQPLACFLFITSVFAECNRVPFDLPEAEQELVGGYHTEYSGMKFALYFLGEYTHMITTSFLVVVVFFGGWLLPWVVTPESEGILAGILKLLVIAVKMTLFIIFYMFIRWTIPRFRFDQLMSLAWKVMMPLALLNMVAVLYVKHYQPLGEYSHWLLLPVSIALTVGAAAVSLRMPQPPPRAPINYPGHPVTGMSESGLIEGLTTSKRG